MEGEQREPIEVRAISSLGLGFDFTSDFRLRFAKGYPGKRLVVLDEKNTADLVFPGGFTVHGISSDIRCDKGEQIRFCSDVYEFNQIIDNFSGLVKVPEVFFKMLRSRNLMLTSHSETSSKDGLTVICSKRGGDPYICSHSSWLQTVPKNPDAVLFKFVPITSLRGSGYLSHAINLYLRYKPDSDELRHFLEFQVPRQWATLYNELNLGLQHPKQRKSYPILRFRLFGPKLLISTNQASSDYNPAIGLRLYLEGPKSNQPAIHIQHLSSLPSTFASATSSNFSMWQSSEDAGPQFFESIQWKSYSRICTAAVKHNPKWFDIVSDGVFIVTGAQLVTKGRWLNTCFHLRLLFSHIPNGSIQRTEWAQPPSHSHKGSFFTSFSAALTSTLTHHESHCLQRD